MTMETPVSIYEVHPGSWMRVPEERNRPLTQAEIAPKLAEYVRRMNFTHVELLSAARGGLEELIGFLGQNEIGVILDSKTPEAVNHTWDRIWARETLAYLSTGAAQRKFHHQQLTVRDGGAPSRDLVLPLSHELVTLDKGSLLARMPGDNWQKFANMRLLFGQLFGLPGRKLIFMGAEFGQWNAWNPDASLDWHLVAENNAHGQLQRWVAELNWLYRSEPALYQGDFEWIEASDAELSTLAYLRRSGTTGEVMLAAFNFTPEPRRNYRLGVPGAGFWQEVLNSDALEYGGSGQGNLGGVEAAPFGWHGRSHSLMATLPPLGVVFFKQKN